MLSPQILQAKGLIEEIRGQSLSLEERKNRAIALAALMIDEAERIQTKGEREHQAQLAGMMRDPIGKVFTTTLTDQCFRSRRPERVADQLAYVINRLGIPAYLPLGKRLSLKAFAALGKTFSSLAVPLTVRMLRKETSSVILPGEAGPLAEHMKKKAPRRGPHQPQSPWRSYSRGRGSKTPPPNLPRRSGKARSGIYLHQNFYHLQPDQFAGVARFLNYPGRPVAAALPRSDDSPLYTSRWNASPEIRQPRHGGVPRPPFDCRSFQTSVG